MSISWKGYKSPGQRRILPTALKSNSLQCHIELCWTAKKIDVDRSHWKRKCIIKQKITIKNTLKTNNKNSQYDDQQIGYAAWNAKSTRKSYMTISNKLNKNTDMGIKKPLQCYCKITSSFSELKKCCEKLRHKKWSHYFNSLEIHMSRWKLCVWYNQENVSPFVF